MAHESLHQIELPRILLAEEDHEIRALWKVVLDRAGYEVTACDRAADLRTAIAPPVDFDLVVCNVRLLDTALKQTVARLQQQSVFPPLVVITAYRAAELPGGLGELKIMAVFDQPFHIRRQLATFRAILPHV
jgi:DNA-binding response OmpR family regulator